MACPVWEGAVGNTVRLCAGRLLHYTFIEAYFEAVPEPAPIILMSASIPLLDIERVNGVIDFLAKPFDLDDLFNLLQKYLGRQQAII
jgi:CheY-like chemotaxis protein